MNSLRTTAPVAAPVGRANGVENAPVFITTGPAGGCTLVFMWINPVCGLESRIFLFIFAVSHFSETGEGIRCISERCSLRRAAAAIRSTADVNPSISITAFSVEMNQQVKFFNSIPATLGT